MDALQNLWANNLQNTLKQKKIKRNKKKDESPATLMRQNNENLSNILKNIVRTGNTPGP